MIIQGHCFRYQSPAYMRLPISLVINDSLGPILHRFRDTTTERSKIATFPYPISYNALAVGEPFLPGKN